MRRFVKKSFCSNDVLLKLPSENFFQAIVTYEVWRKTGQLPISMALSSLYTFCPVRNFVRLQWSRHLSREIIESELSELGLA